MTLASGAAPTSTGSAGPATSGGAPASVGALRARLRADVALAARVLPVHHPLHAFIAVNPINGLIDRPFHEALTLAGDLYGSPGTLPETAFRAAYAAGRITDADLAAAVTRHHPELLAAPPIVVAGQTLSTWAVVRADLLHGTPGAIAHRRHGTRAEVAAPEIARAVDDLTGKWCAAYLGVAGWPLPGRERGFYPAWRELARHDRALPRAVRAHLADLPARADDAILHALQLLAVADSERLSYLQVDLTRLPGWAAHARWHAERPALATDESRPGLSLLDFLALRLSCEALLLLEHRVSPVGALVPARHAQQVAPEPVAPSRDDRALAALGALGITAHTPADRGPAAQVLRSLPVAERCQIWQHAYEWHYRDRLLTQLTAYDVSNAQSAETGTRADATTAVALRPLAQVVCCIDTRSEGLRRHLERVGPAGAYETFGFAGFFAVAIRFQDLAGGASQDLCPALISPTTAIRETPAPGAVGNAARRVAGLRALSGASAAFHAAKDSHASPFVLAEAGGLLAGVVAAAKTASPGWFGATRHRLHRLAAPAAATTLTVSEAFPLPERVLFAQVALTTMGLTDHFAPLVVMCGHGSTTENNPYQAALDCGACGGHRGAPNARTAAAILNDATVRAELPQRGIAIPADTLFLAAEHDTASDRLVVLDRHLIPTDRQSEVTQLSADLEQAGQLLAAERSTTLPDVRLRRAGTPRSAARHAATRSVDWAQVYPEWGLAGNAAFIIGPRSLTCGLDLQRRVFLHSYDAAVDPDGTALETILTAPLVVAHWINAQYYFSSVAPKTFGAGTKTIHNVVGGVGVLAGHAGDLQLGLPLQSVAIGDCLVHEPMRLLALAQAPLERIEAIIDRNRVLQHLLGNEWLTLSAREENRDAWRHYTPTGWREWTQAPQPPISQLPTERSRRGTRTGFPEAPYERTS